MKSRKLSKYADENKLPNLKDHSYKWFEFITNDI